MSTHLRTHFGLIRSVLNVYFSPCRINKGHTLQKITDFFSENKKYEYNTTGSHTYTYYRQSSYPHLLASNITHTDSHSLLIQIKYVTNGYKNIFISLSFYTQTRMWLHSSEYFCGHGSSSSCVFSASAGVAYTPAKTPTKSALSILSIPLQWIWMCPDQVRLWCAFANLLVVFCAMRSILGTKGAKGERVQREKSGAKKERGRQSRKRVVCYVNAVVLLCKGGDFVLRRRELRRRIIVQQKIRFIYFQFTELKVFERVNICTLFFFGFRFFIIIQKRKTERGLEEGGRGGV